MDDDRKDDYENIQKEELEKLQTEIKNYPILKRVPMVMTYALEKGIEKCVPTFLMDRCSTVGNALSIGVKSFFCFVFPIVYIYQRDKDSNVDSIMQYEE